MKIMLADYNLNNNKNSDTLSIDNDYKSIFWKKMMKIMKKK